jgi:hypothetical protein
MAADALPAPTTTHRPAGGGGMPVDHRCRLAGDNRRIVHGTQQVARRFVRDGNPIRHSRFRWQRSSRR